MFSLHDSTERNEVSNIVVGDRVEIVGEIASEFQSKMGLITAVQGTVVSGEKFTVRLADGTEAVFRNSQLRVPPVLFADMIFDTKVSPVPFGVRGGPEPSKRHMRFVSRQFDIHVKLAGTKEDRHLLGQINANEDAQQPFLITLLFDDKPFVSTTTTDILGEFDFDGVPSGNAILEGLVPSFRIVARFEV